MEAEEDKSKSSRSESKTNSKSRSKPRFRFTRYLEAGSERIYAFSDGVFAIAVTLLILDIKVPDLDSTLDANQIDQILPGRILDLWPQIGTYALSFMVIGLYWILHHRMFSYIKRYDSGLLWLNNLFLLTIAFQPLPTAMLGRYRGATVVIFYAGCQIVTNLIKLAIWFYASHNHRLIDPKLSPYFIRRYTIENLDGIIIFAISIVIAFFNATIAQIFWGALVLDNFVINWLYPREESEYIEAEPATSLTENPKADKAAEIEPAKPVKVEAEPVKEPESEPTKP